VGCYGRSGISDRWSVLALQRLFVRPPSIATITETINDGPNIVGSGTVVSGGPLSVFISLDGAYASIRITKDILLVAAIGEEQSFAWASLSDWTSIITKSSPNPAPMR
jgi:hypothetical protein